MSNRFCILLTACVRPNGMSFTSLQDESIRYSQYVDALRFYLENTTCHIVVVENTNTDFSELFKYQKKIGRLEYYTFEGNNYDNSLGKGYGESLIIRKAYEKSKFLRESNYVIKITGRVIVTNIKKLIKFPCLYRNLFLCDFFEGGIYSMIFISPPKWIYETCISGQNQFNDSKGIYFEHVLYQFLINSQLLVVPFFHTVEYCGISGSTNENYVSRGQKEYLMCNLNSTIRFYELANRVGLKKVFQLVRYITQH